MSFKKKSPLDKSLNLKYKYININLMFLLYLINLKLGSKIIHLTKNDDSRKLFSFEL